MKNYVDKDKLQEYTTKLNTKLKTIFATKAEVGSPLKASTVAEMTDESRIYVYTGSESGYTAGNWYYYNGSAWTSGGVYNSTAFETDATLAVPGMAADAKAVGDALANVEIEVDATLTQAGKAADAKAAGDAIGEIEGDVTNLKTQIEDKVDVSAMQKCRIVETEPSDNLLDFNGATMNVIINTSTGATSANNSYWTTDFIPVESGKTYYLYVRKNSSPYFVASFAKRIAAFDSNKEIVSASGTTDAASYTVPVGVAYIRFSREYSSSWVYYLPKDYMLITDSAPTEFIPYVPVEHYYVAKDEFLEGTSTLTDKIYNEKYLDDSMVNRLDPNACETGKIINITTGIAGNNASYFTTDFIAIDNQETLYFYRVDTVSLKNAARIAAYDANKTVIPSLGTNSETDHITQSGEMAYIRISFSYYTDYARSPQGTACLANSKPDYIPGYNKSPVIKSQYLRQIIKVYATDTEAQIIQKFIQAFETGNCDVYFERSNYTFGTELAKVNTDYGMLRNEIPIGNGCRYFFNGATLTATLDLSQLTPAPGDTEFYCNFLGCQRRPSSYELHDGVLIATDTRYVVHDESSAMAGSFRHLYQNMELHYHTNARQEDIRKCIGGGTGASGVVEIVGCKFTTDGTDSCVSFHGNGTDVVGAEFDLNVRNSWFSNNIRAGALSAHQTARLFYCGNSSASVPTTYENWTVTSFLNEVRT